MLSLAVPQFSHKQLQTYRYGYEQMPYTAWDPDLAVGEETIFEFQDLSQDTAVPYLALVNNLAATPTANVFLRLAGPGVPRQEATQCFPSGLAPVMAERDNGERSTSKMALKWFNNTGAVANNQQVNYVGALKALTTADKVLRGLPLTAEDRAYQKKFQIYLQGLRPLTVEETLTRIWRRSIVDEDFFTGVLNVGAAELSIPRFTVPAGTVFVIHSLAASIPSASVGNLVTLSLDRDTQENHMQVLLDNAPGLGTPWPLWITTKNTMRIVLQAQTATNNVVVRLGWYRVKITGLLSVVLGDTNPSALTGEDRHLYELLKAGVVA